MPIALCMQTAFTFVIQSCLTFGIDRRQVALVEGPEGTPGRTAVRSEVGLAIVHLEEDRRKAFHMPNTGHSRAKVELLPGTPTALAPAWVRDVRGWGVSVR